MSLTCHEFRIGWNSKYLHPEEEFPGGRLELQNVYSPSGALRNSLVFNVIRENNEILWKKSASSDTENAIACNKFSDILQ